MITSTTAILVSIVAGLLSCIVSLAKLIDRRRQTHTPSPHSFARAEAAGEHDLLRWLPLRRAPVLSGKQVEKVARLGDVAPLIQSGDGGTFSGRSWFSYPVRFLTFSDRSHAVLFERDEAGLWVVDSCEGLGVTKRPLAEEVRQYPGQLYWAPIAQEFRDRYDRRRALEAARAMLGNNYGWFAVLFQLVIHQPFIRAAAYLAGVDRWFSAALPFCSAFVARCMRAGGLDPVPGRDAVLVTPQDIAQSLAFGEWVALVP